MLKHLIMLVLMSLAAPAFGQATPPPTAAPVKVALETSLGRIVIEIETVRAPITAKNFLRYVDNRRFDGIDFYRAMRNGPETGLIQAGQRDPRRLFPPIAHEPTSQTGVTHVDGAISMARFAPGTATADFSIMVGAQPYLDAGPLGGGDQLGYAAFGKVIEGMDVVRKILASPISPTEGEGVMRGQMLAPKIRITRARRVP